MLWWALRQLRSGKPEKREQAAVKLGNRRKERSVQALVERLDDRGKVGLKREVRDAAAEALIKIGEASVKPLVEVVEGQDRTVRKLAAETLEQIGSAAVLPLAEALDDQDQDVRRIVVRTLGRIKDEVAIEPLAAILTADMEADVRKMAAAALGTIRSPESIQPLIKAFRDEVEKVMLEAVAALGQIGGLRLQIISSATTPLCCAPIRVHWAVSGRHSFR